MSRPVRAAIVLTIVAVGYGCSLDWTIPRSNTGATSDASPETGFPDASDDALTAPETTVPTDPDVTTPLPLGSCRSTSDCTQGVCVFDAFDCGKSSDTKLGTCLSLKSGTDPSTCASNGGQYCACDGKVYDSACAALQGGVDLSILGCGPASTSTVGYVTCPPSTYAVDDPSRPHESRYRCESMVTGCDASACACLLSQFCQQAGNANGKCEGAIVRCF